MTTYLVAVLCVLGMAAGQLLFKISANSLAATGSFFAPKAIAALSAAVLLYGLTSLSWVWVLQRVDLGRAYPLMALAFVLVPVASHFVFGERFAPQYFLGVSLIIAGILVATRS